MPTMLIVYIHYTASGKCRASSNCFLPLHYSSSREWPELRITSNFTLLFDPFPIVTNIDCPVGMICYYNYEYVSFFLLSAIYQKECCTLQCLWNNWMIYVWNGLPMPALWNGNVCPIALYPINFPPSKKRMIPIQESPNKKWLEARTTTFALNLVPGAISSQDVQQSIGNFIVAHCVWHLASKIVAAECSRAKFL